MAPDDFRAARSIALVGMMGAGKTTIGAKLAARLALPFVDADAAIEQAEGLSAGALFDRLGEPGFRACERRTIARLVGGPRQVIAAGGGAFVDPGIRRLLLDRCLAVWLDAPVETLAARIGAEAGRPLLRGREPRAALAELDERRRRFYAEAPIRVEADAPPGEVVDRILAALAACRG